MIKRDQYGIICQHAERGTDDPSYMDGGDSASRTGIMALCGSEIDQSVLELFFKGDFCLPVRHPYQKQFQDFSLISRDQLMCLAAGCFDDYKVSFARTKLQRFLTVWTPPFLNKDIIMPQHLYHLHCCAYVDRFKDIKTILLGWLSAIFLLADILWNTKINPVSEQNQLICMLIVRGPWWVRLYLKYHPDPQGVLMAYWDSWRDQPEIGEALWAKLQSSK